MTVPDLDVGLFTPALRSLAVGVMDKLLVRPAAIAISGQTPVSASPFRTVRDRLAKKKYAALAEWNEAVVEIINAARASGDETVAIVCNELDRWFSKRYNELLRLSEFRFKEALAEVVAELTRARNAYSAEVSA
jgi:hypothetical protein